MALKGLAECWATANDHLLAPETCTWEEFKRLFRTRFRPSDFEPKLQKDIFTVRQCTGETIRAYMERYQIDIALRDVPSPQNPPTATERQWNGFSTGTC